MESNNEGVDNTTWIPYDPDKIILPEVGKQSSFGSEETGYLLLESNYQTSDLSDIFKSAYLMAIGEYVGVVLIASTESVEDVIEDSYGVDGYAPSEVKNIYEDEGYIVKQYYASMTSEHSHYCSSYILNKETGKVTIITVASMAPMSIEEFAGYNISILQTYSLSAPDEANRPYGESFNTAEGISLKEALSQIAGRSKGVTESYSVGNQQQYENLRTAEDTYEND